jgi:hypothetical protein
MDNPEKMTTLGRQDEKTQTKDITQNVLDTNISKQTHKRK